MSEHEFFIILSERGYALQELHWNCPEMKETMDWFVRKLESAMREHDRTCTEKGKRK